MKFALLSLTPRDKLIDVTQAADKVWSSPPAGLKPFAHYAFLGIPFPGYFDPNMTPAMVLVEAESGEAIMAAIFPVAMAGCTMWCVPLAELPLAGIAEVPKKLGG